MSRTNELEGIAAAHDLILREMLSIMIGLGRASGAWTYETSDSALQIFSAVLSKAAAAQQDDDRSIVLLAFARHCEGLLERNLSQSPPRPRSDEGLQ